MHAGKPVQYTSSTANTSKPSWRCHVSWHRWSSSSVGLPRLCFPVSKTAPHCSSSFLILNPAPQPSHRWALCGLGEALQQNPLEVFLWDVREQELQEKVQNAVEQVSAGIQSEVNTWGKRPWVKLYVIK